MASLRLRWSDLLAGRAAPPEGALVELAGWALTAGVEPARHGLLLPEPPCCGGCLADPAGAVEIFAAVPLRPGQPVTLRGRFRPSPPGDPAGWRYQLHGAEPLAGFSRRAMLACSAAAGAGIATPGCAETAAAPTEEARRLVAAARPMDLHSHAGRVLLTREGRARPFEPLAAPMREGGMRLIALAMVADTPATRIMPDGRIQAVRDPAPGELYAWSGPAFARLAALLAEQEIGVVTDRASLEAALAADRPAAIVAAEGADFLEGRIARVEEAFAAHRLRHLQLVHYRVNELGDIQTAPPMHEGLTPFGAEVVRACNRLGIVVDMAHASFETVRGAVEATTKPLVLSHSSVTPRPGPRSRQITPDHARLIARTGGVIGVWPPAARFPDLRAYAEGIAQMADAAGVEHVGIGTDMMGLVGPSTFPDYRLTPAVADALLRAGFGAADAARILGGNQARVLRAVLA